MIKSIFDLSDEVQAHIIQAACEFAPDEMCGLVGRAPAADEFVLLANMAANPSQHFEISSEDWQVWADWVVAVVHSHPNGEPFLSGADRQAQVATGLAWVLAVAPFDSGCLKVFQPVPHLRGREFVYGKSDCYRLIQDAYHLAGIQLPEVPRTTLKNDMENHAFEQWIEPCGFYRIELNELQAGDVILTASQGEHPDHVMLYLGNETVLHHALGQLSRREHYHVGAHRTHSAWRHQKWLPEMMAAIEADLLHSQGIQAV